MSRFYWTKETKFTGYSLRDEHGYARSIVSGPNQHGFWYGQVFMYAMPGEGPFLTAQEAADWVTGRLDAEDLVPRNSSFGSIDEAQAARGAA
jgi:hypothetical protein